MPNRKLRVAFIHPDLGIGGAERLVVDTALGLQKLEHKVEIFTSHHDPKHCFEETRDGTLTVHAIQPPPFLPRSIHGAFHILLAHLRQLHLILMMFLFYRLTESYDVFFVDQLSTCVPILRALSGKRVLFYCHFPDKLLVGGAYDPERGRGRVGWVKRLYRVPMDALEELTTGEADRILANSHFTKRVISLHMPSVARDIVVVYPGINLDAYKPLTSEEMKKMDIYSERPTYISLNRFEVKKNIPLAIKSFAKLKNLAPSSFSPDVPAEKRPRLVLGGGYDPRVEDNDNAMRIILSTISEYKLTYSVPSSFTLPSPAPSSFPSPISSTESDIHLLPNFSSLQRSTLLSSPSTLLMLYTPSNEHFGIGPVEGMCAGLPVLACDSGGPVESILDMEISPTSPASPTFSASSGPSGLTAISRSQVVPTHPTPLGTGFLRPPIAHIWSLVLLHLLRLPMSMRLEISQRGKRRAVEHFGMESMARGVERGLNECVGMGRVRWGYNMLLAMWVVGMAVAWGMMRLLNFVDVSGRA